MKTLKTYQKSDGITRNIKIYNDKKKHNIIVLSNSLQLRKC